MAAGWLGRQVEVCVEAPRGTVVKRRADGRIDFISPVPVPFHYGHVVGETGGDGDPLDAILVGAGVRRGHRGRYTVRGVVHFVDQGQVDDKLVCGEVGPGQRVAVELFFAVYVPAKRALQRWRGTGGWTGLRGIEWVI